jgi:hypothetical protein
VVEVHEDHEMVTYEVEVKITYFEVGKDHDDELELVMDLLDFRSEDDRRVHLVYDYCKEDFHVEAFHEMVVAYV